MIFTKTFDFVNRNGLSSILQRFCSPGTLLSLLTALHHELRSCARYKGQNSTKIKFATVLISDGHLPHAVLCLFLCHIEVYFASTQPSDVAIHSRSDDNLFNLAHLRPKTQIHRVLIRELVHAADAAFATHSEAKLQVVNSLAVSRFPFHTRINAENKVAQAENFIFQVFDMTRTGFKLCFVHSVSGAYYYTSASQPVTTKIIQKGHHVSIFQADFLFTVGPAKSCQ